MVNPLPISPQQFDASAPIHPTPQRLHPIDVAFDRTVASRFGDRPFHRTEVRQLGGREDVRGLGGQPAIQGRALAHAQDRPQPQYSPAPREHAVRMVQEHTVMRRSECSHTSVMETSRVARPEG